MGTYEMSAEERDWLETYDITEFDRPSVAADMAVFSIMETAGRETPDRKNYRKDPEKCLKLLLIRRGSFPFKNRWALPGGFCRRGESTQETAMRELQEETGVRDAYLRPFAIFSEAGRDPRGWIISHAFLTLINGECYRVHEGSDAWEARWFRVDLKKEENDRAIAADCAGITNTYTLYLSDAEDSGVMLTAVIREARRFRNYHETVRYEIVDAGGLAFDHASVILCAFLDLRRQAEAGGTIVFDLMPELFTLSELQKAYETVLGRPLLTANFRRKIAPLVTETQEAAAGAGHRPARLFRRNLDAFYC